MLSNQIIQKSLDELKAITKVELEIYDLEGIKIAGTSSKTDVEPHIVRIFAESAAETQELESKWLMKAEISMYWLLLVNNNNLTRLRKLQ